MQTTVTRRVRLALTATIAAMALGLAALIGAAPASAAGNSNVNLTGVNANGSLGVNQYLTITVNDPDSDCIPWFPETANVYGNFNNQTALLGPATFQNCVGDAYQYLYIWAPNQAGVWYVYGQSQDGSQSAALRSAISTGSTTTTVAAANTVRVGVPTTVTATVKAANGGTFSAQGTVTFTVIGGATIGTATLNNSIPSTASIQWTPGVVGTVSLVATYTPQNNGAPNQNTNCGGSCTSAPDVVSVTSTGVDVYLANPPGLAAGIPSTITAVVSAVPSAGSVTFSANGAVFASNVPVPASGQVTAQWTPPAPGNYTLSATWVGSNGLTATSQDTVAVSATPAQSDQIVVVASNGVTLATGASYTVPNGTQLTLTSSTASGAAIGITSTGPCTVTTTNFSANSGTGVCVITASSPGGNGFGPASGTVTVNLVPGNQTAKLAAPASGNVNVGKTITLAKASQGKTNIGKPISWKITKGKNSVCTLSFPSNGSVKLKIKAKGKCTVQASAAGVSGQWNPYKLTRTYTGK